jgi:hypothetical protein
LLGTPVFLIDLAVNIQNLEILNINVA